MNRSIKRACRPMCEGLEGRQLLSGNYYIANASSGKVLGDPGFSTSNGTSIVQWDRNGGLNEQWQFDSLGNGNYAIVNAASGKVLGDPGFSNNNGTPIVQWDYNGGLNEQWTLS